MENNWISVEDRLPEHWSIVFACDKNDNRYLTEYRFTEFYRHTEQIGQDRLMDFYYNDITHWMPLPEPPQKP